MRKLQNVDFQKETCKKIEVLHNICRLKDSEKSSSFKIVVLIID